MIGAWLLGLATLAALVPAAISSPSSAVPPAPTAWVTDDASLLSTPVRAELNERLQAYEHATGHQVLVWIGQTTGDVPIEDFAVRAFAAWKVGRKGLDDGVVLFVMARDRKLRIEVGYGLEAVLPDVVAARILRERMAPRLLAGEADGAVQAGVDAILSTVGGAPGEIAQPPQRPEIGLFGKIALAVLALLVALLLVTNPSMALWLLYILASGNRRGGDGLGGRFSGGGGRSGGGGASGGW